MARSAKNNGRKVYKWLGHIQVYFNEDEAQAVIDYVDGRTWDFEDIVVQNTQAEMPTKFTYNVTDDCYQITIQPKSKDCYLYGYTIGFNHVDLLRGLCAMSYIITEMIEAQAIELPGRPTAATF